ncbi:REP-associated tyrosine transposase [Granulicella tundricola]|uniref:Transposase IS200-like domain-containing protein n=1 Tax=Granulicella tundricola (strain ATCC BAA-1859 / DSM 23138 / MP5ACTX9) TaxID=1198114 RepID=E8WVL2_GRATM|nr:transposase [Granulicella tundricola]ADW69541.1 hypothetical protein AciX9_2509 [Granulicella tundricola MP5ACTX9]
MFLAPQELRTYFITTVTADRHRLFQLDRNATLLLNILETHRLKQTYALHAFVLMPDHVHLLLTPSPLISLEKSMQLIKGGFSFQLKSGKEVWARSYDSRRIEDRESFLNHETYTHLNPVKSKLSPTPAAYPYSSAALPHRTDPPPSHFR